MSATTAASTDIAAQSIAAQKVIDHLRKYGANARVALIGHDFGEIRKGMLEGPHGLFTLFGEDFGTPNVHLKQFNHERGGQVQQFSAVNGSDAVRGQLFTLVWADFAGKLDDFDKKLVVMAQRHLRTHDFVQSTAGIVENRAK